MPPPPPRDDLALLDGPAPALDVAAGAAPAFALGAEDAESLQWSATYRGFARLGSPTRQRIEALRRLAGVRFDAKDYDGAIGPLTELATLAPRSAPAQGDLAVTLRLAKRPQEAETHCRRALALDPNYAASLKLLAALLAERRAFADALKALLRLAEIAPDDAMAHNDAGLMLSRLGRRDEAAAAFARALALAPADPRVRFNALMLRRDDAVLPEAIACCRQALAAHPDNNQSEFNLAEVLRRSGLYDESITHLERVIERDPDHCESRVSLALMLLLRGDWARGWDEYEQRWRLPELPKPGYAEPLWQGEDFAGRTLLLHAEQGLGDAIQMLRYVPAVAARGGRVVLRVERALVRLAASLDGGALVIPMNARPPPFDIWRPLMSLPRLFETRPQTIPAPTPYLRPRAAIVERWRRRLADAPGLKVGLAWAGNPAHANDFRRSIAVERLAPLLRLERVAWIGLQVGPRAGELARLAPGPFADLSAQLHDLSETAGAILNLDLVISVDTGLVHLAGALDRPVWTLTPFSPDWRWGLERPDTPWYPSMRLFRQPAPGDWASPIAAAAEALAQWVARRHETVSD